MPSKFIPSRSAAIFLVMSVLAWTSSRASAAPKSDADPFEMAGASEIQFPDLTKAGWVAPRPPYAYAAMKKKEQGKVWVKVTTDATGKVIKVETPNRPDHLDLEATFKQCVQTHWHGPPSVKIITYVDFVIR